MGIKNFSEYEFYIESLPVRAELGLTEEFFDDKRDEDGEPIYTSPFIPRNGKDRNFSEIFRNKIWCKTGGRCGYCGKPDAEDIDHIVPRSKGGSDDPNNLMPCCKSCNSRKGVKYLEEFREYLTLIQAGIPVECRHVWLPWLIEVGKKDWLLDLIEENGGWVKFYFEELVE